MLLLVMQLFVMPLLLGPHLIRFFVVWLPSHSYYGGEVIKNWWHTVRRLWATLSSSDVVYMNQMVDKEDLIV